MRDVSLTVDGSLALHLRMPRAVELPFGGELSERGVERVTTVPADVARALPVAIESPPAVAPKKGVTIGETATLITDPGFGKYPHRNGFRDELLRSLELAVEVWGDVSWESIDDSHWTQLLRRRCADLVAKGCSAVRATEITIARLVTAASWLRDTKRIARDAAIAPRMWKQEIPKYWKSLTGSHRDPQPRRLRYTRDEFQRILAKSDFDPRFYLLVRVAVGLRPGQVARARRSDLTLPPIAGDDYGTLVVHGAGKKGGATIDLTRGQRDVIDRALTDGGYLAAIEQRYQAKDVADYVLFPSGYVVGRVGMLRGKETQLALADSVDFTRQVSSSWVRKSWRTAEERAGIEHIDGRSTYSQRRQTVDEGVSGGLSPSAIQALGGWADSKIALEVYRDQENKTGRREARPVRARMLGEVEA